MAADYSLYLVTDSTKAILGDRDLVEVVRAAVAGGSLSPSSTKHSGPVKFYSTGHRGFCGAISGQNKRDSRSCENRKGTSRSDTEGECAVADQ